MTVDQTETPHTEPAGRWHGKQRIYCDLAVVFSVTIVTYLIAGYFDLAERYIDWTALGEVYQLDEIVFVLLAGCLALIWFSARRLRELNVTLQRNLTMQTQLRESNLHSQQLLHENQDLVKHMSLVRESERHHLATELHDVFGQHLAAMDANLTVALNVVPSNTELYEVLQTVMNSTDHLRTITRNKLRSLKPPSLDSIGLSGAVHELLNDWQQSFPDISIETDIEIDDDLLSRDVALTAYRALQEGLVNISRHASASRIRVSLQQHRQPENRLRLVLEDNGRGLAKDEGHTPGLGLLGIRERSLALGGHFELSNVSPSGVRLSLNIPF